MTDFVGQNSGAIIALGGVLIGSIISGGFAVWNQYIIRRSEERRQKRDLAIKAAIECWKMGVEDVWRRSDNGILASVAPLDHYIVHMIKLSDLIDRQDLSEADIAFELSKIRKTTKAVFEAAKEEDKKEGRYPWPNDE